MIDIISRPVLALLSLSFLLGCQSTHTRFELRSANETGISFINEIKENDRYNMVDFYYMYNGGGVGIGDLNNDQLPDLYFTGNLVADRIYLNKGNLKFEDVTATSNISHAGWSSGVTMADVNADGWIDIYVCRTGNETPQNRTNLLYINKGDGSFEEKAAEWGVADAGYATQAAFFDYDRDGDLDLFILNHTNENKSPSQPKPIISDGSGLANDRLYQNQGNHFIDVTIASGITFDGMGLGLAIGDLNDDGWLDVCIANDFVAHDFVYVNNGDGTFTESVEKFFAHMSHFGMGNELEDINNDGLNDLITLDMLPPDNYHRKKMTGPMNTQLFEYTADQGILPQYMRNTLQLNRGIPNERGGVVFDEVGYLAGIEATDWSWCPLVADFDNDGWKDLFITNGYLRDITDLDHINYNTTLIRGRSHAEMQAIIKRNATKRPSIAVPNFLFRNNENLAFDNVGKVWGLDQESLSNGASYADLDNDGDLDLVTNNINQPAFVYENTTEKLGSTNYLKVFLKGGAGNLNAIGSTVTVFHDGGLQSRRQMPTRGFQSAVGMDLHFGLGDATQIDSLRVDWSDGTTSNLTAIEANQYLTIDKNDLTSKASVKRVVLPLFVDQVLQLDHPYQHRDPYYNDFLRQFLIPHKFSQQGPAIAVGDMDGDGRDDFFVGGAYRNSGKLFYQREDGSFKASNLELDSLKNSEDIGALLFDSDQDGDLDLYVVSGSNEHFSNSVHYADRLYLNKGRGIFELAAGKLPNIRVSGSCVKAADFDADGDLDLFVGGRLVPLQYPEPGKSRLLINHGGEFKDGTAAYAEGLSDIGMVTDALWTDFNNDNQPDLIVVGEYMPITFWKNVGGKLERVSGLIQEKSMEGWWNSINSGDFDNDGDTDYIVGNLGLNTGYRVSAEEPLTVYARDFDNNGYKDAILTHYLQGREYPVHSRDDLLKQVSKWKLRFSTYGEYADATLEKVLSQADKEAATQLHVNRFESVYLENNGPDGFEVKALPLMAQKGPIYGIFTEDLNADGNLDLILTGNSFATEVVIGNYDAMNSEVFLGNGNGEFEAVKLAEAGLHAPYDNKALTAISIRGERTFILTANQGPFYSCKLNRPMEKIIEIEEETWKLEWLWENGTRRVQEVHYGSSYLAQSTRKVSVPNDVNSLILTNYKGESKMISF